LRTLLKARFGIEHITLQPETADATVQTLVRGNSRSRSP